MLTVDSLRELGRGRRRTIRACKIAFLEDATISAFIGVSGRLSPWQQRFTPSQHVHGQKVTGRGGCDGTRRRLLPDDPAARHWIIHRIPAGAAVAGRAGCFLFRCYCPFKTRPRCVCGSRSVKNRVRVLPLQEAAVTAAPAAASSRQPAALGHSHGLYDRDRIKSLVFFSPRCLFFSSVRRGCRQQEVEAAVAISGLQR